MVPADLVGLTYQQLVDGFSTTHEVIPFPWDWRASIADAATVLEKRIAELGTGRTIHLIGHGAGGLVIRKLGAATWEALKPKDGRALLLATSEHGMFAAVDWCSPRSRLVRMLKLADGGLEAGAVAAIFRRFRSVLELLPDAFLARRRAWMNGSAPACRSRMMRCSTPRRRFAHRFRYRAPRSSASPAAPRKRRSGTTRRRTS